ncbi:MULTISPECIES: hybrid sensor histidine kinase/response regulator [Haloarcula]|uniref:ATP-binding response regulator n=1 Tax=Haloarcula TaxID=2237 RepID=UPI0023EB4E16|nr:ATP-binding protein [Halomicroarcula sp. XH51]
MALSRDQFEPPPTAQVVLVDDDREFLDLSAELLARHADDVTITTLADPLEVLDRLETATVDCVVSDYNMRPLNGIDLLRRVREVDPDVPFILFTGRGSEAVASEAISAGVTDYVQKSGDSETFEMLSNRIQNAVDHARSERELARKSSLLDSIFAQIPHHVYVKDREGRHVRVSDAYVRDTDEMIGKTDAELYHGTHGEETFRDDVRVIEAGEAIVHKEEQKVEGVDDNYSSEYLNDNYDQSVVDDRRRYDEWVLTSKVPWRDEDGEVLGLIGVTVDISDRKHYQQSLERHTERLEQFLAEVAHDIRSPLQVASSNAALLEDVDEERMTAIERSHERIAALADELSRFARHGDADPTPEPVDLADVVEQAWASHSTGEATLSVGDLPTVEADSTELGRLVDNLIDNAIDHAGPDPSVTVGPLEDGGFFVADDGPGIPPDEREAVFETGYTTALEGTGLGLAIVSTVVERHGWTLSITESEAGGARFEIRT